MAMVWLVLRYKNNIRSRELGQMVYARWNGMLREGKFGMPYLGGTREPWIDKNGQVAIGCLVPRRRRTVVERREGEKECTIGVEMLDCQ